MTATCYRCGTALSVEDKPAGCCYNELRCEESRRAKIKYAREKYGR